MINYYKKQIKNMIDRINDEKFLKRIFIIICNHIKKGD